MLNLILRHIFMKLLVVLKNIANILIYTIVKFLFIVEFTFCLIKTINIS